MISEETSRALQQSAKDFHDADDALRTADDDHQGAAEQYLEARRAHQAVIAKADSELDSGDPPA